MSEYRELREACLKAAQVMADVADKLLKSAAMMKIDTPQPEYQNGDVYYVRRKGTTDWWLGEWHGEWSASPQGAPLFEDSADIEVGECIRPAGSVCVPPNWEYAKERRVSAYLCEHGLIYMSERYQHRPGDYVDTALGKIIRKLEPQE